MSRTDSDGNVDVLVVGAGPTGLTLAGELCRHGVDCRLVDRLAEPAGLAKACSIMPRTLEVLDDLEVGPAFHEAGLPISSMRTFGDGEQLMLDLDFSVVDSRHAYVLSLQQSETERLLGQLLVRRGGRIERGVEVVQLEEFDDHVRAELEQDGHRHTVRARYVVGCDGAHSFVRHALGFGFPGSAYPEDFMLGHVRIDWATPANQILMYMVDRGSMFVTPLPDDRWLMVADLAGDQKQQVHDGNPTVADLQQVVDERVGTGRVSDPVWTSFFHIHHRQVERYGRDRVFLAGDAAHIHSPMGGQGMNTGIQDAYNLAWKLALVLRRGGSAELLDSYDQERRPVGKAVLRLANQLQVSSSLRAPLLQAGRNAAMRAMGHLEVIGHYLADQLGEVLYSYHGCSLAAEHRAHGLTLHPGPRQPGLRDCCDFGDGPRAGDRAPDAALADGRLHSRLGGGRFALVLFEGTHAAPGEEADLVGLAARAAARLAPLGVAAYVVAPGGQAGAGQGAEPAGCQVLRDPEQTAHHAYGARGQCLYFIRPDGYVAYRSQPVDLDRLVDFARQRLCPAVA